MGQNWQEGGANGGDHIGWNGFIQTQAGQKFGLIGIPQQHTGFGSNFDQTHAEIIGGGRSGRQEPPPACHGAKGSGQFAATHGSELHVENPHAHDPAINSRPAIGTNGGMRAGAVREIRDFNILRSMALAFWRREAYRTRA
jgi:hypothetical protein